MTRKRKQAPPETESSSASDSDDTSSNILDGKRAVVQPVLELKPDHGSRPLWIDGDNRIYLEAFSPILHQAQDLLVAIAEPVTRPKRIHEYKLTEYSLYAAVSVGLSTEAIIEALDKMCKSALPLSVLAFIKKATVSCAKIKLVLKDNHYWVESRDETILQRLLREPFIRESRIVDLALGEAALHVDREVETAFVVPRLASLPKTKEPKPAAPVEADPKLLEFFDEFDIDQDDVFKDVDPDAFAADSQVVDLSANLEERVANQDEQDEPAQEAAQAKDSGHVVHSFEIRKDAVETVKKKTSELGYPILEEYDFHADHHN
ncbi:hypothetical protein HDU91_001058, partial [Kappamyces sp. JEL0680]